MRALKRSIHFVLKKTVARSVYDSSDPIIYTEAYQTSFKMIIKVFKSVGLDGLDGYELEDFISLRMQEDRVLKSATNKKRA